MKPRALQRQPPNENIYIKFSYHIHTFSYFHSFNIYFHFIRERKHKQIKDKSRIYILLLLYVFFFSQGKYLNWRQKGFFLCVCVRITYAYLFAILVYSM